jgi:hypothetical protein
MESLIDVSEIAISTHVLKKNVRIKSVKIIGVNFIIEFCALNLNVIKLPKKVMINVVCTSINGGVPKMVVINKLTESTINV